MKVFLRMRSTWGVVVSLFLLAQSTPAQTDQERAAARDAARAGISEFRNGNYAEALSLLETAERVVHAPTHLLYIARSQAKAGMLVEARESYQKIINENLSSGSSQVFRDAQESAREELSELSSRIPKLKITLLAPDGTSLKDAAVKIDDQLISGALVGLPIPANPGARIVTASAPGMLEARADVTLEEGASEEVTLKLEADPSAAQTADGASKEGDSEREVEADAPRSGKTRRTVGWVTVSTGAAFIAGGAVLGVLSSKQLSDARGEDALCSDNTCTDDGWTEVDQARMKALVADIGVGVGIATLGVGVYLLVTGKQGKPETATMRRVLPYADRNGGYIAIRGAF